MPADVPFSVFLSYSHRDEALRERLETHLALLRREGRIAIWHDRKIRGGETWAERISDHLEAADVVLLLVSADFLASDYCYQTEMRRALERHRAGSARVVPVVLRPCDWQSGAFGKLQRGSSSGSRRRSTAWWRPGATGTARAPAATPTVSAKNPPTPGGSTTCTATCGSGRWAPG